jgi:hypothetical protein
MRRTRIRNMMRNGSSSQIDGKSLTQIQTKTRERGLKKIMKKQHIK